MVDLVDHYADLLLDGLEGLYDVDEIVRAYGAAQDAVEAQASPEARSRAAGIAAGNWADEDAAAQLIDDLRRLLGEAYVTGGHAADDLLADAGIRVVDRPWDALVDWDAWEPGNTLAAAQMAGRDGGRGLAQLLSEADVTIRNVDATTIDRIGEILGEALDEGLGSEAAGRRLRDLLGDRQRAVMIAQTELARAVTVASLDSFDDYGVEATRWLLSVGACPKCIENAEAGVVRLGEEYPNGNPPVHPRCVCALAPVVDDGLLQAHEDGTAPRPEEPAGEETIGGVPDAADHLSDHVVMKGRSSEYQGILDQLDETHGLPTDQTFDGFDSRTVTVKNTGSSTKASGRFYAFGRARRTMGPPEIDVYAASASIERRALTFVHELGHYVDADYLRPTYFVSRRMALSTTKSEGWTSLFDAVRASPSYQRMLQLNTDRAYWTDAAEIWARAYSQWVATVYPELQTTEGITLAESLDSRRRALIDWDVELDEDGLPTGRVSPIYGDAFDADATARSGQWSDEEFGLIAQAVETILRERGLMT